MQIGERETAIAQRENILELQRGCLLRCVVHKIIAVVQKIVIAETDQP
jgi:hypothetical protein